jgi:hypothetical protein
MAKRNVIYSAKYDREVALVFAIVVCVIILCSGCMRNLQPSLEPLMPEQYPYVKNGCGSCIHVEIVADTVNHADTPRALVSVNKGK